MKERMEAVQAGCVYPVASPPIPRGVLLVRSGRIVDVLPPDVELPREAEPVLDLGEVALTPAWINAHAHLELSDLDRPLGQPGTSFADWIPLVLQHRNRAGRDPIESIRAGLSEAINAQTAAVGDVVPLDVDFQPLLTRLDETSQIQGTVFFELIGWNSERAFDTTSHARFSLNAAESLFPPNWKPGLSPHAPHTASEKLLRWATKESVKRNLPIAMHLAETKEELRLLRSGDGPLYDLMAGLGPYPFSEIRAGRRPLDYLRLLAEAPKALVIHGNYLDNKEIEFLAKNRERMSAAYCPRSHAHFGHDPYPLARMLESGVRAAIGTDGRASAPDLDVYKELLCCAARHPTVGKRRILEMGTLAGAEALGVEDQLGTLEPGKLARWAVSPLGPLRPGDDPCDRLFPLPKEDA